MAFNICWCYDLRRGSIILTIIRIIQIILSPIISIMMCEYIRRGEVMIRLGVTDGMKLTIICSCIICGIALYGSIERKSSWLLMYLIFAGIGLGAMLWVPLAINIGYINSDRVSQDTMLLYWAIDYVFFLFTYFVIYKYYKQLKRNLNVENNERIVTPPSYKQPKIIAQY